MRGCPAPKKRSVNLGKNRTGNEEIGGASYLLIYCLLFEHITEFGLSRRSASGLPLPSPELFELVPPNLGGLDPLPVVRVGYVDRNKVPKQHFSWASQIPAPFFEIGWLEEWSALIDYRRSSGFGTCEEQILRRS